MKYLCLAYGDQKKWDAQSKSEMDAIVSECRVHDDELKKRGHLIFHEGLDSGTTTLRFRNGKLSITDGPFAETKEHVGGFFIIEARDLNEAIQIASIHPAARMGEHLGWCIEVRPIFEREPGQSCGQAQPKSQSASKA